MATTTMEKPAGEGAPGARKPGHAAIGVKALRAAMKSMSEVVEKRNTIPVLAGVLVSVGPSTMTLTATDMDLQLVQQLDLAEPGKGQAMSLVIDAATLEKITAKLPADGILTLDDLGGMIEARCGRTRYSLPTLPAEDFPVLTAKETPVQFEMARATLQQLLEAVAFAQSSEETRFYLNGIFLEYGAQGGDAPGADEGGVLTAVATDGHRLAVMSVAAPEGADGIAGLAKGGVIIGSKAVRVLGKLLDADEGVMAAVSLSERQIIVEIGTVTMTAKLVDGQFPDYRRVIPSAHERSLWIAPKAMIDAVDRILLFAEGKARALRVDLAGDIVCVSARSPELGSALTIGFNGSYLIEILRHLTADPVLLRMGDAAGPVLVMDSEDARRRFVIMPCRV